MCEGLQISNIILIRNVKTQGRPKRALVTTTVFRLRGLFFCFSICVFLFWKREFTYFAPPFFLLLLLFPRPRLAECYPRRHPEATGCASHNLEINIILCFHILSSVQIPSISTRLNLPFFLIPAPPKIPIRFIM